MFTGKNKEQFEKWCVKTKKYTLVNQSFLAVYMDKDRSLGGLVYWNELPLSMQLGVYLEYLDSVSYHIKSWHDWEYDYYSFNIVNLYGETLKCISGYKSRREALTEAFKKADEIINNK